MRTAVCGRSALRHRLRCTAPGSNRRPRKRPPARPRSKRPRTTCPGATAPRRCSATPPPSRCPASRWTAPPTTPTSTRSTAPPDRSASAWCGPAPRRPPRTPDPLVMTTGSDLPSSVQLPVWLSRAGADVLKSHPIVAIDRRGMGTSSSIDCRDLFDRQEMLDQAQFQSGDDPVANLGAITMTATTSCTDTIAPGDSAYDNAHAAEDIERLRSTWDVPVDRAARHRQRGAGGAGLCGLASRQGGAAGARLALAARHRRRSGHRAAGQGRADRAGRVRRAVRGHQLPDRPRSEGRRRRPARRRAGRRRTERSGGLHGRRRDQHGAGLPARRPHRRDQQPGRRRWPRRAPATPTR